MIPSVTSWGLSEATVRACRRGAARASVTSSSVTSRLLLGYFYVGYFLGLLSSLNSVILESFLLSRIKIVLTLVNPDPASGGSGQVRIGGFDYCYYYYSSRFTPSS